MPNRAGRVVATSLSDRSGVPKHPQPSVTVTMEGVEGDWHAGPVNRHVKTGEKLPNTRMVTVVAKEVFDAVGEALGIELQPGALAENFLVEGLGDLSGLAGGDRLRLGADVVIEVTGQNTPCSTLAVHHRDIVRHLVGRRGIAGIVAHPGTVRPGDAVEIVASRPHPATDAPSSTA